MLKWIRKQVVKTSYLPETHTTNLSLKIKVKEPVISDINVIFPRVVTSCNLCFNLSQSINKQYNVQFLIPEIYTISNLPLLDVETIELTHLITEQLIKPPKIIDLTSELDFFVLDPEGKNYQSKIEKTKQLNLFDKNPSSTFPQKQYEKVKENVSSSLWDLLYPLLLPPLDIESTDEFQLYKPLRAYQQKGVGFLVQNKSALLADQMGTGKTVQTIVALRALFRTGKIKSALIVCPPALLGSADMSMKINKPEGWDGHLFYWSPELQVTLVRGNLQERKIKWKMRIHVYITTYDTLRRDLENDNLTTLGQFDCIILDEAQKIKNKQTKISQRIRALEATYRWALTGTPMENNIEDVISIFHFLKPTYFQENQKYTPLKVKEKIQPYMLRRLKSDIPDIDLPDKIYSEEWLELDSNQRAEYDKIKEGGIQNIKDKIAQNQGSINNLKISSIFPLITKLKQICNFSKGSNKSPKIEFLLDFLDTISKTKQKVLIFSQFTNCDYGLERIEKYLSKNKIQYVTYTGTMSNQKRNEAIHRFKEDSSITVFLGSIKSAGAGLNLPEADYVIHFDHWWNPATMWQAEDRAHRLGREKHRTLFIYSLWMKDTIEQDIRTKLKQKGIMIEQVIDALSETEIAESITTEEWLEMLGVEIDIKLKQQNKEQRSINVVSNKLKQISPIDLETISKNLLVAMGYINARLTPASGDGGIDVFGSRRNNDKEESIIVQCKHTSSVGVNVARELLGVMRDNEMHQNISKGLIITTGKFTSGCKKFAGNNQDIELMDGELLAKRLIELQIEI